MLLRFLFTLAIAFSLTSQAQDRPPNIIFILIDDMGWTDLGCYGSKYYETPHLDQLAKDGMRFTQAYSACTVCSPTRAAILTGKSPARLHVTDWIAGHNRPNARLSIPEWTKHLPEDEETLAERLKTRGYATASIGKWHLGGTDHYPEKHGFDVNIGGTDAGSPPSYFSPYKIATLPDGPQGEFLTDRLTTEAIGFIEKHKDQPFFIYLPHYAVHTPIMGKPDVVAKYQAKKADGGHSNPVYAALVESVDDGVGRMRETLKKLDLSENTLFVFTSDNGGLSHMVGAQGWKPGPTDNSPSRLGKGGPYDGGVHIPLIIAWPGTIEPGTINDSPVISYDHVPTLLEATGTPLKEGQVVDGESLMPLLTQKDILKREAIYWHYPHYHPGSATPYSAIRAGDWKLIEFFEDQHVELYNLRRDVGEADNVAAAEPDIAQKMQKQLSDWRTQVGAQLPVANEKYDPERAWESDRKKKRVN
ncbi:sulfatase [Prosthecobacter dejongeii]|uniref:Arylsulfatase A-like enzyme n=1 Tax=Prosthecobacter dejongeii TaxID=48465 RepID=A0A7W7YN65_9BACT|nr:sulfatase [Prosthecobacter dejongeii]MBB5039149.1 arylsulfatase A-like enzyme [Prosthecobacter dejongeii]